MNKHTETFMKSMDHFRRARIKTLEREYDQTVRTRENQNSYETIHEKLQELIGPDNNYLLIEYTDFLIAEYNNDPAWFYDKGFQDCQSTYGLFRSVLKNADTVPPLQEKCNVELTEELDELINS